MREQGVGWVTAAPELVTAVRSAKQYLTYVASAGLAAAGFAVHRPAGTYFVTTDIRSLGQTDGFAFCRALPQRAGWWPSRTPCSTTTGTRVL